MVVLPPLASEKPEVEYNQHLKSDHLQPEWEGPEWIKAADDSETPGCDLILIMS